VLLLCHPVKNATRENLLPRGGGAFLNELDGNLTLWREGDRITLHWQGKFRRPNFDPIHFQLKTRELDVYRDRKGRPVRSVVAVPIDDTQVEVLAQVDWTDENRLLFEMLKTPDGSVAQWARSCAWTTPEGEPAKSKVHRLLTRLDSDKLVRNVRGKWVLTKDGRTEAERCS
jgi:hypothetical protein